MAIEELLSKILTNNTSSSTLSVNNYGEIKNALPTISIGDVINATVRQNFSTGQGILFYEGALIQAKLPPYLITGDELTVKVENNKEALLLKILDIKRPNSFNSKTSLSSILNQLDSFITSSKIQILNSTNSVNVNNEISSDELTKLTLSLLKLSIKDSNTLVTKDEVANTLNSLTNGSLSSLLKETISSLNIISDILSSTDLKGLTNLLNHESSPLKIKNLNEKSIKEFLNSILKDSSSDKSTKESENKLLNALKSLNDESIISQKLKSSIFKALKEFKSLSTDSLNTVSKTHISNLKNIINHLEKIRTTQDILTQLNPVLNTLGEPILVVFPFLFKGLISNTKIRIYPEQKKENKGKSKNDLPYKRVEMTVPLPSMGTIGVDIAHREEEILVKLTLEDKEVESFLLEQLEHLALTLKDLGFNNTELTTKLGQPKDNEKSWYNRFSSKEELNIA